MIQIKTMECDYYYRHSIFNKDYFNSNNKLALNQIAKKLNLKPKKYISRLEQKELLPLKNEITRIFEIELLNFPVKKLSQKVLSLISQKIYYKNQFNFMRNNFVQKSLLFYDVHEIELHIKVLKYILEKRLELNDNNCVTNLKNKPNLELVIEISKILYNLNLCLDFMYY